MDGVSSVVAAARAGHINVVEHLLDQDWNPDSMVGNINFVEKIMEKGGDKIDKGKATLAAASTGNMTLLQYLLSHRSDVHVKDDRGRSVLMICSSHGHIDIIECLINTGVDLEENDNEGLTPLTHAIINDQ